MYSIRKIIIFYPLQDLNLYFKEKVDFESTASTNSAKWVDEESRIRTYDWIYQTDLQSVALNHSAISPCRLHIYALQDSNPYLKA